MSVRLTVNGASRELWVDPRLTLLDLLREELGVVGPKKGCDHGQCGACTVLCNGRRIYGCLALAASWQGAAITTVEGLGTPDELHPLQAAFVDHDALQCGFCTPGQICSAAGLLDEVAAGWPSAVTLEREGDEITLDAAEIGERMSGNLCRCGAYPGIAAAIKEVGS